MASNATHEVTADEDHSSRISEYCALGCIALITPRSGVSGMAYLMQRADLGRALPKYVENFIAAHGQYPLGAHTIVLGSDKRRIYKFPDDPLILDIFGNSSHFNEHDVKKWLAMDWYVHGNNFHSLRDDDPPELILRCPLRNDDHIDAAAHAFARIWNDLHGSDDPRRYNSTYKPLPIGRVRDILEKAESDFHRSEGYPPNLAALWRLKHPALPQIMMCGIEAYVRRYFASGAKCKWLLAIPAVGDRHART